MRAAKHHLHELRDMVPDLHNRWLGKRVLRRGCKISDHLKLQEGATSTPGTAHDFKMKHTARSS